MAETMYEIRVAGVVTEEDVQDIGAVTIVPERITTVLYGISDEAAMYGLLARLRALGIEVTEVRRVPGLPAEPDPQTAADQEGPGDA